MDELRAGNPVTSGRITIVPVERWVMQAVSGRTGGWFSGLREPFAVIVCDATQIRALDLEGLEISVESLVRKIPDLGQVLAAIKDRR